MNSPEWWTQQQAGLIFGLIGASIGILGGLLGVIGGVFARRGSGKHLAITIHLVGTLIGIAALTIAGIALMNRQPFHVWFWCLHIGILNTAIFGSLWFLVTRRLYAIAEARRLDAELFRHS